MKNYYEQVDRKFTFNRLEVRKLSEIDIFILTVYTLSVVIQLFLHYTWLIHGFMALWMISFIIGFLTITTPIGSKFRKVYFFSIWLANSCLLLISGTSFSLVPLLTFLLYQLIRYRFWKKFDKEFIPCQVTKDGYERYVSKIEGRGGYKEDKTYMKILFRVGMVLLMICLFGLMGQKI